MMDRPENDYDIALRLDARLADGSIVTLVRGPLEEPLTPLSALWPPQDTRSAGMKRS